MQTISSPSMVIPSYAISHFPYPSSHSLSHTYKQTVIEADGNNVHPVVVDSIHIFTGQRYSIILNATQPTANYWIRADPFGTASVVGFNMAILHYAGAPLPTPTTNLPNSTSDPTNLLLETDLHPLLLAPSTTTTTTTTQRNVDIALNLKMEYNATSVTYTINGATFVPPTVPVLLQILSGARSAKELLPPGSVYTLPRGKVVELSIPGGAHDSPVCCFS
jgi:iron transport multicopper oxidase